jgi:hypothetical protein
MVNLEEFLTLPEGCMVYVFDSHRPLNLHNLFGSSQVEGNDKIIVIDDGQTENISELKAAFEELEVA